MSAKTNLPPTTSLVLFHQSGPTWWVLKKNVLFGIHRNPTPYQLFARLVSNMSIIGANALNFYDYRFIIFCITQIFTFNTLALLALVGSLFTENHGVVTIRCIKPNFPHSRRTLTINQNLSTHATSTWHLLNTCCSLSIEVNQLVRANNQNHIP